MKKYGLILYTTKSNKEYAYYHEIKSVTDIDLVCQKAMYLKRFFNDPVEFATHYRCLKAIKLDYFFNNTIWISNFDKFLSLIQKDKQEERQ